MKDGHWSRHLNRMRTLYHKKQKTLLSSLDEHMIERVNIIGSKSGVHILLEVKNEMSEDELIKSANRLKVKVYPTSIYYDVYENNEMPKIILDFGGVKESKIC